MAALLHMLSIAATTAHVREFVFTVTAAASSRHDLTSLYELEVKTLAKSN